MGFLHHCGWECDCLNPTKSMWVTSPSHAFREPCCSHRSCKRLQTRLNLDWQMCPGQGIYKRQATIGWPIHHEANIHRISDTNHWESLGLQNALLYENQLDLHGYDMLTFIANVSWKRSMARCAYITGCFAASASWITSITTLVDDGVVIV